MSERQRHVKARQAILRGEAPEKRIFIAQEDLEFKKKLKKEKDEEQKRVNEKLEITKEARVPWFCPECDKIMKKRLDDRMWYLYGHCLDCQVKVENRILVVDETNRLALISPNTTINIIQNYKITEKRNVKLPKSFVDVFKCTNPTCISNASEPIISELLVLKKDPPKLRCKYCSRILLPEEILLSR